MQNPAPFSAASVAVTCSGLAEKARETAAAVDTVVADGSARDPALQKELAFLSTRLQQFRQHVDQLGQCVAEASVVSAKLQAVLVQTLPDCDKTISIVSEEVKQAGVTSLVHAIVIGTVSEFEAVLAAYSRVFFFATQLATLDVSEEQDSKLDHVDAQRLLETAGSAAQRVSSSRSVLLVPN
ncbi:hypothetical protein B0T26DRAFT_99298 [Lasiosphaeria miniovina]|uniref:Uncharacterized protein n=1 Tax=Lasiosphaeria miniovina TaxID=1954250 RepID=A0AA40EGY6_9PEZI|nr:uncharacterized protein B0T26DRAFT_99298 [Lasiosphaeria miniovina]KAK0735243.1 hypothetical protein B0T26DRAFT_99298 [Lasiosphaeria miniovina]